MSLLPRQDPLPAFNFQIALLEAVALSDDGPVLAAGASALGVAGDLAGLVSGGFAECTGLDSTIEILDYAEGGVNDRLHRLPGRASFGNLTLKRGMGLGDDLWLWHEEFLNGQGKRRDGLILMLNEARLPIRIWGFYNGIPTRWIGPSFNAGSSAVAIEALEIAHEKLVLLLSPGKALDGALSAVGAAF